jgi:hypothetical protein
VRAVAGQPGQAVLFVERLVHATMPWKGRGQRRSLFFKYVQKGMHCAYSRVSYSCPAGIRCRLDDRIDIDIIMVVPFPTWRHQ